MPIHSFQCKFIVFAALLLGCGPADRSGPATLNLRRIEGEISIWVPIASTPDLQLTDVRGALTAPNGDVAVADAGLHQVILLDSAGRSIGRIGRQGGGPAEFEGIALVAFWGDSLLVHDPVQRRLSFIRRDGSLIRQQRVEATRMIAPTVVGLRGDGAIILRGTVPGTRSPDGGPTEMQGIVVALRGEHTDTVARFDDGVWHPRGPRWYSWRPTVTMSDSGVWVGAGGRPELRFVAWDGNTMTEIRWDARTRAVGEADKARIVAMAEGRNASPELTAPDRFADSMPYFARVLADPAGGLWVIGAAAPFEFPDSAWRIDLTAGTIQGMALPPGLRPTQVGVDFLLGVLTDEDGVGRPARSSLERTGASHD
jgi:hypothetical protein